MVIEVEVMQELSISGFMQANLIGQSSNIPANLQVASCSSEPLLVSSRLEKTTTIPYTTLTCCAIPLLHTQKEAEAQSQAYPERSHHLIYLRHNSLSMSCRVESASSRL
jgi:hypothetical protein